MKDMANIAPPWHCATYFKLVCFRPNDIWTNCNEYSLHLRTMGCTFCVVVVVVAFVVLIFVDSFAWPPKNRMPRGYAIHNTHTVQCPVCIVLNRCETFRIRTNIMDCKIFFSVSYKRNCSITYWIPKIRYVMQLIARIMDMDRESSIIRSSINCLMIIWSFNQIIRSCV